MVFKQAVVLAAGEGERLRPFTASKPKVMIRVANKPILEYVVEALERNGIRRILFVVGYKKEKIMDYFGDGADFGVEIDYVFQEHLLVADIIENPIEEISNLVNTGIYAFSTEIFDDMGAELTSTLKSKILQGCRINACETHGDWLDSIYPWNILSLNEIVLMQNPAKVEGKIERGVTIDGEVTIGRNSVIRANSYVKGPVSIGENCDIGPNACIFPSTSIGNDTAIGAFTEIRNSVLMDDVKIGSFSAIHDSIFDTGSYAEGGFIARSEEADIEIGGEYHVVKIGAMVGEYCEIGSNVIAHAGAIIGNRSKIKSMKELSGKIPDGSWVV